jgi:hypothetical protein
MKKQLIATAVIPRICMPYYKRWDAVVGMQLLQYHRSMPPGRFGSTSVLPSRYRSSSPMSVGRRRSSACSPPVAFPMKNKAFSMNRCQHAFHPARCSARKVDGAKDANFLARPLSTSLSKHGRDHGYPST